MAWGEALTAAEAAVEQKKETAAAGGAGVSVDERTRAACEVRAGRTHPLPTPRPLLTARTHVCQDALRLSWIVGLDERTQKDLERAAGDTRPAVRFEATADAQALWRKPRARPVGARPKMRGGVVAKVASAGRVIDAAAEAWMGTKLALDKAGCGKREAKAAPQQIHRQTNFDDEGGWGE